MHPMKDLGPSVFTFVDPVEYLQAVYEKLKEKEESYSYLQFAEDLGFSKSNVVHLMLRGKRPITLKSGEKMALALGLKGMEKRFWLHLVAFHHATDEIERGKLMSEIVELRSRSIEDAPDLQNQLDFFTEWFHSILFEMASLKDFSDKPEEIAARLDPRIRPEQAKKSLAVLEGLGLFVRKDGRLQPSNAQLSTGDEVSSLGVVRYHQNMIELGRRSLTAFDAERRDVSSISFACNEEFIQELKTELSQFRKKILQMAEKIPEKDCVYQMNLQLFPVTKKKN